MKRILAIFSIVLIMLPCMVKLATICWFKSNQDFIALTLCENKAKPKMHCNGKCHLAKQLKKVDEKGTSEKAPKVEKSENSVYYTSVNTLLFISQQGSILSPEREPCLSTGHLSIFAPPPQHS